MTGASSRAGWRLAVAALALGAWALRVFPFFGPDGAWSFRVDYDEGVYFSAAAYLLDGVLPWRDYVFAHPPGQLFFLALTSAWTKGWLGVAGAFALSRWIAALLGAVTTVLVARVALRWDAQGALLAAALYATYPELVQVERGPFLEPLLNLVCVASALLVLRACEAVTPRRVLLAGAVAGVAVAIKVWAVIWVLAGAWALAGAAPRREALRFLAAAALSAGALVLPLALLAPGEFVTQVGLFHLWRPPDGLVDRLARVGQLVSVRHLLSPLAAALVLAVSLLRPGRSPVARLTGVAWGLTVLAFFASAAWWSQYNAHLAASEALLAAGLFSVLPVRARWPLVAVAAVSLALSVTHAVSRSRVPSEDHLALRRSPLRETADCVFTFEPGWSLAAGRLPPRETGPLLDSYAHQLLGVLRQGRRFPDAGAAFAASPLPAGLAGCRWVVASERTRRQLPEGQLEATHHLLHEGELEVWTR